ncbi:MAG: copper transporter [Acidimicrobiia bacterium]|nr:copper transporter [Acidimicrobiia bacterium]MBP8181775.1 copper transporter [Acidimicrobiia bacterium]
MINFRFHLISLIAVFLSLAIGVVFGSTVIDRAIVDGLEQQIERVETKADEQRAANSELSKALESQNRFLREASPVLVDGRLDLTTTAVIAMRGIDEAEVSEWVGLLRQAGSSVPYVIWLEPRWALANPADEAALASVLTDTKDASAEQMRRSGLRLLSQRLADGGYPPASPQLEPQTLRDSTRSFLAAVFGDQILPPIEQAPTTTTVPNSEPAATTTTTAVPTTTTTVAEDTQTGVDPLEKLVELGFVALDPEGAGDTVDLADYPTTESLVVVLGGQGGQLAPDAVLLPLVQQLGLRDVPTFAGEIVTDESSEEAGLVVGPIRRSPSLSRVVSTSDDLATFEGQLAAVAALDQLSDGVVNHLGTRKDAQSTVPAPIVR